MFNFRKAKALHIQLGRRGESIAKNALLERKMDFLCQNYRCKYGELDLIFRENATLCIVEVKTRHRLEGFRPADAVNHKKRKTIIRCTDCYLREIGAPDIPVRFDIVEVIFDRQKVTEVNLICTISF